MQVYIRWPEYRPLRISSLRLPGRSSLWGARLRTALAAHPGLALSPKESAHEVTSSLLPSSDGFVPAWPCSRRGLPGRPHYCERRWSLTPPFHSDPLPCGRGDLFLWPFSGRLTPHGGFPTPGAIRRRALWSADFPRSHAPRRTAIARPACRRRYHTVFAVESQPRVVILPAIK